MRGHRKKKQRAHGAPVLTRVYERKDDAMPILTIRWFWQRCGRRWRQMGLTIAQIAKRADRSVGWLSTVGRKPRLPWSHFERICAALDVDRSAFWMTPYLEPVGTIEGGLERWLASVVAEAREVVREQRSR